MLNILYTMGFIGAGLGAAGSIFGAVMGANAARKQRRELRKQQNANRAMLDNEYNAYATQRGDAMRMLERTREYIANRGKMSAGSAAVTGGTEASVAADKETNASALSNAVSEIVAAGEQRKDAILNKYQQRADNLDQQVAANRAAQQQAMVGAVQGLASAAGQMDFGEVKIGKNKTLSL